MKAIITIDIMAVDFPAEVEFHYSEAEGQVVNVNNITLLFDSHTPQDLTAIYFKDAEVQEKINEELTDRYKAGDYEEA